MLALSTLSSLFARPAVRPQPVRHGFVPTDILQAQLDYVKRSDCDYFSDLPAEVRQQRLRDLRQGIEHTLRITDMNRPTTDPTFRRARPDTDAETVGGYVPGRKKNEPECFVYTSGGSTTIPGTVVLNDWDDDSQAGDKDAPQLRKNTRDYLAWLKKVAGLNSIDGSGFDLHHSLHYGSRYNNAFWDGKQMTYGDGDGVLFRAFHLDATVPDHEIDHGATEFDAGREYTGPKRKGGLDYSGESGGINEHYSDAAAIFAGAARSNKTVEQMTREDWLIGVIAMIGNNKDGTKSALRSFLQELAYDRRDIGKDKQIKHYKDYRGQDVHYTSGIANHALYLAAQKIKGDINDTLAPVWAKARRKLHAKATFREHHEATVVAAKELFPDRPEIANAIAEAWKEVGVNVSTLARAWYRLRTVSLQISDVLFGKNSSENSRIQ